MITDLINDISWGSIIQTKHDNHDTLTAKELIKILNDFPDTLAIIKYTMYQGFGALITHGVDIRLNSVQGIMIDNYDNIRTCIMNFNLSLRRFIWSKWNDMSTKNVFTRIVKHTFIYGHIDVDEEHALHNQIRKKFN